MSPVNNLRLAAPASAVIGVLRDALASVKVLSSNTAHTQLDNSMTHTTNCDHMLLFAGVR
jgi:hypothetical protein